MTGPVVVAGASGFVGRNVVDRLSAAGRDVRCGTRDLSDRDHRRAWVRLDVDTGAGLDAAFGGADAVVYLVHGLADHGPDLIAREEASAQRVLRAAEQAGVRRIVYLGGPTPDGEPSVHLRARLQTGEVLRSGRVSVIELRASMIVGAGSESWLMCRDLALRLPLMVLPRWLATRTQPIGIDDVVTAIVAAVDLSSAGSRAYDLPGPEILTAREILERVARQAGFRPVMVPVPVLTPRLSSWWLRFVTRADYGVARQLVDGMTSDLVAAGDGFWAELPDHVRVPFDEAVCRALAAEGPVHNRSARLWERAVRTLAVRAR
ncbi:MAG: NAD(P)H-binding protein [Myxococcota bacterium]